MAIKDCDKNASSDVISKWCSWLIKTIHEMQRCRRKYKHNLLSNNEKLQKFLNENLNFNQLLFFELSNALWMFFLINEEFFWNKSVTLHQELRKDIDKKNVHVWSRKKVKFYLLSSEYFSLLVF